MDHREEIVDEIFRKCDVDHSGTVEINEFVGYYLSIKNQLLASRKEREIQIKALNAEIIQLKEKQQRA